LLLFFLLVLSLFFLFFSRYTLSIDHVLLVFFLSRLDPTPLSSLFFFLFPPPAAKVRLCVDPTRRRAVTYSYRHWFPTASDLSPLCLARYATTLFSFDDESMEPCPSGWSSTTAFDIPPFSSFFFLISLYRYYVLFSWYLRSVILHGHTFPLIHASYSV